MTSWTRREALKHMGSGFGALSLAHLLAAPGSASGGALDPKPPHFPARATRVIFLFMNGGPSHVDTFDPKPALAKYAGQTPEAIQQDSGRKKRGGLMPSPFTAKPYGQSGIEVTELYPEIAKCIDDLCVIRSMHSDNPNHEPALLMMN